MRATTPILILLTTGLACANDAFVGPIVPEPVDQGYADVSPLQTSQRVMWIDQRLDTNFETVYRHPTQAGKFFRQAGGIYAVFDQSDYVATPFGTVATIPPGTEFYVGTPDWLLSPAEKGFVGSADTPARPIPAVQDEWWTTAWSGGPAHADDRPTGTISDEVVRRERLSAITRRALDAVQD